LKKVTAVVVGTKHRILLICVNKKLLALTRVCSCYDENFCILVRN